jgi:S1-C subfamily serine protease
VSLLFRRFHFVAALTFVMGLGTVQAAIPLIEGRGGVPTLAPLIAQVTPAVVNISTVPPQRRIRCCVILSSAAFSTFPIGRSARSALQGRG